MPSPECYVCGAGEALEREDGIWLCRPCRDENVLAEPPVADWTKRYLIGMDWGVKDETAISVVARDKADVEHAAHLEAFLAWRWRTEHTPPNVDIPPSWQRFIAKSLADDIEKYIVPHPSDSAGGDEGKVPESVTITGPMSPRSSFTWNDDGSPILVDESEPEGREREP